MLCNVYPSVKNKLLFATSSRRVEEVSSDLLYYIYNGRIYKELFIFLQCITGGGGLQARFALTGLFSLHRGPSPTGYQTCFEVIVHVYCAT